jgi:hypothetical protein
VGRDFKILSPRDVGPPCGPVEEGFELREGLRGVELLFHGLARGAGEPEEQLLRCEDSG